MPPQMACTSCEAEHPKPAARTQPAVSCLLLLTPVAAHRYSPSGFLAVYMMYLKLRMRLYPSSPTLLHRSINSCSSHSRYLLLRAWA
jgi:hypothetical protein